MSSQENDRRLLVFGSNGARNQGTVGPCVDEGGSAGFGSLLLFFSRAPAGCRSSSDRKGICTMQLAKKK